VITGEPRFFCPENLGFFYPVKRADMSQKNIKKIQKIYRQKEGIGEVVSNFTNIGPGGRDGYDWSWLPGQNTAMFLILLY
jgi:hypothetical protein